MKKYPEKVMRVLRVVWLNREPMDRYYAKPIGEGPGWEVWDRKEDRAVPPKEMKTMTFKQVTQKLLHS